MAPTADCSDQQYPTSDGLGYHDTSYMNVSHDQAAWSSYESADTVGVSTLDKTSLQMLRTSSIQPATAWAIMTWVILM